LEKASRKKWIYTEWMVEYLLGRGGIGQRVFLAEGRANVVILWWEEAGPTRSFKKARATEAGQGR